MKKRFIVTIFVTVLLFFVPGNLSTGWAEAGDHSILARQHIQKGKDFPQMVGKRRIDTDFGNIPLYFIPNKGQMNEKALFCAKTHRYSLWLTKQGLVFDSISPPSSHPSQERSHAFPQSPKPGRDVSRLIFLNANKQPVVVSEKPTDHRVHYFKGKDKSRWCTDIPTSKVVRYKNLYKNIDLKVYGIEKQIEYDWVVKPGGDPGNIQFQYRGVKEVSIDEKGNLVVQTAFGKWLHKKPLAYQVIDGRKVEVEAAFEKQKEENSYGFRVGSYDKDHKLIIDPLVLVHSGFLGSSGNDGAVAMAVDASGYLYVAGWAGGPNFPTASAYQPSHGGNWDCFITKFTPDGSGLVFSTYLGGGGQDYALKIVLGSGGLIYIAGSTSSTDFPTVNPYQAVLGGYSDAFAAIFSADGSGLLYSTYLGGSYTDYCYGLGVTPAGEICLGGTTFSNDFPVYNAYDASFGGISNDYSDAFLTKFNASGDALVFSTYLGDFGNQHGSSLAIASNGDIYFAGSTYSSDFPVTQQAYQTSFGGQSDGFISRFTSTGALDASTFYGGSSYDSIADIALDSSDYLYIVRNYGSSMSTADSNAIVAKFNNIVAPSGHMAYSKYLGDSSAASAITVDSGGKAYITGRTLSPTFPVPNAFQDTIAGGEDAFVLVLSANGSTVDKASFLGGTDNDRGSDISVDSGGSIYVCGDTWSPSFPVYQGFQMTHAGSSDGFVCKIDDVASLITLTTPNGGEEWGIFESHDITWDPSGLGGNVLLYYSTDNGDNWQMIAGPIPNSGTYAWTIPETPSDQCLVKVEHETASVFDESDAVFTIAPPTVTVTSPNGGESWGIAETHDITWTTTGEVNEVLLYYSTQGSGWQLIAGPIPNSGTYAWTIPEAPSEECLVKVELGSIPVEDESDAFFTIAPPTVTVTSPNGGESWGIAETHNITWTTTGVVNEVVLYYSTQGSGWQMIAGPIPNSGTYAWTIPEAPSDQCLVKVELGSIPVEDESDAFFTIAPPTVTVTSPNGGENWQVGSTSQITWTTTGVVDYVVLYYSTDGASSWQAIAGHVPNTGSYNWLIPSTPSTNCLVKVEHESIPVEDISDQAFTILLPTIAVTSPIGGESWQVGTNQFITWNNTGAITNVSIDYSTDSGSSWDSIVSSTPNTGSYNWTIPDTPSAQCLVRITDTAGLASDVSDAFFSILAGISPSERDALIAIYNNTNGDNWIDNSNWRKPGDPTQFNDPGTEHTWIGVTCTPDHTHVIKINLASNSLYGAIPDLSALTQLTKLNLEDNQLIGTLPATLNNLANLQVLDVGTNSISSPLPDISSLSSLTHFDLSSNLFNENIPNWISSLTTLNTLDLSLNQFTGTIPDLSSLVQLTDLNVYANQLSGSIPIWINSLTALTNLNLSGNQFTGTIPDLSNLTALINLDLAYNDLIGTIPGLSGLTDLTYIGLNDNHLSGAIPDLSGLTNLWRLDLSGNQLSGSIPSDIGTLTTLRYLFLHGNQLGGSLPTSLTNLTNLNSNGLELRWNGLYTDDTDLRDFLNSKQNGGDWESTQTIAPTELSTSEETHDSVKISWTPILYQSDSGGYRVYYSTTPGSGYTLAGTTADKTVDNYIVTDLTPNTTYYFVVETFTNAHTNNENTVTSEYSTEVSASTLEEPTLTITAPNGGQSWEAFTSQVITWSSTGSITDVKIEYSTDNGGLWNTIVASTPNSGTYDWTVPNTPSSTCLVRISDTAGPASDVSNAAFTIAEQRTITVTAPNGGQRWFIDSTYSITWLSTGNIANVMIECSTNSGDSWNTITSSTPNNGSYNWTIPNTPSTNCSVRISDTSGPAVDVSDAVFTIDPYPTITITSPNGGQSWVEGTTQIITWTYTGTTANVEVEYSSDGGGLWNSIVSSTANTGSYNWVIPAVESGNCLVRVGDTATTASDVSDAVFTLWKQPSITVTTPNGGESWKRFTTQTITWTTTGNIQDVKIQYSIDAGGNWIDVVTSTPNDGSYQWNVPNVNRDKPQCLVKIMTLDGTVVDTSDNYFTILKF